MRSKSLALGLAFLALAAACHSAPRQQRVQGPPPLPFQHLVIAALPFDNATTDMEAPLMFRQQLEQRLGNRGYLVKGLAETDDALRGMGITLGGQIKGVDAKEFKSKLGADAVLSGTVHDATSIITGIYNRRSLDAELTLTDTRTGSVIWTWRNKVTGEDSASVKSGGLNVLASAVRGVEKHNLAAEAQRLANIAVSNMPPCPREGATAWNGQALPAAAPPSAPPQ